MDDSNSVSRFRGQTQISNRRVGGVLLRRDHGGYHGTSLFVVWELRDIGEAQ